MDEDKDDCRRGPGTTTEVVTGAAAIFVFVSLLGWEIGCWLLLLLLSSTLIDKKGFSSLFKRVLVLVRVRFSGKDAGEGSRALSMSDGSGGIMSCRMVAESNGPDASNVVSFSMSSKKLSKVGAVDAPEWFEY